MFAVFPTTHDRLVRQRMSRARPVSERLRRRLEIASALPAWLLVSGMIVCAMASLVLSPSWFNLALPTDCQAALATPTVGAEIAATFTTRSGRMCPLSLPLAGATMNGFSIVSPPRGGVLIANGGTGLLYRSQPGFHGDDAFVLQAQTHAPAFTGASLIRVTVRVR